MADLAERLYWRVLVVRCQAGDTVAFEELVGQMHRRLRGFLRKMLADASGVEDVAQEVWIDVFRDLPKLKNPDAFFPWWYQVARNRAYRLLRRQQPAWHSLHEVEALELANDPADFAVDEAQAVYDSLDRLSPEHREVLLLRFMEDMSYEDMAAVIDCPQGTVRSRLHHAKAALRKILERKEPS